MLLVKSLSCCPESKFENLFLFNHLFPSLSVDISVGPTLVYLMLSIKLDRQAASEATWMQSTKYKSVVLPVYTRHKVIFLFCFLRDYVGEHDHQGADLREMLTSLKAVEVYIKKLKN